jgi:hypothetical protein
LRRRSHLESKRYTDDLLKAGEIFHDSDR